MVEGEGGTDDVDRRLSFSSLSILFRVETTEPSCELISLGKVNCVSRANLESSRLRSSSCDLCVNLAFCTE